MTDLESFPCDLLRRIAAYLNGSDALRLSFASATLRSVLPLVPLAPLPLQLPHDPPIVWFDEAGDRLVPSKFGIPVLFPNRTHSFVVRCDWVDQGWGNRKGRLYIFAKRLASPCAATNMTATTATTTAIHGQDEGFLVKTPNDAAHERAPLSLEVAAASVLGKAGFGFPCRLWYKVGGGGGHHLQVSNLRVEALVYDDFDGRGKAVRKPFAKSYHAILPHVGPSQVAAAFVHRPPVTATTTTTTTTTMAGVRGTVQVGPAISTTFGRMGRLSVHHASPFSAAASAPPPQPAAAAAVENSEVGKPTKTLAHLLLAVVQHEYAALCRRNDIEVEEEQKKQNKTTTTSDDGVFFQTTLEELGLVATDKGCLRAAQEIAMKLKTL